MLSDKEILREYINLIIEDDGGDGGGFGDYGDFGDGYGGHHGYGVSSKFFKDIFDAFADPFRHTAAFVENFSSKLQKLAGKLAEDVMAVALPGYKADYEKYEEEYDERQDRILDKYKEVFARTESHLFTGDAALMGFLAAPQAYITGRLVKSSPDKALALVDVLAGSNKTIKDLTDKLRQSTKKLKHVGRMRGGPTSAKPMPVDVGTKKGISLDKPKTYWISQAMMNRGSMGSYKSHKASDYPGYKSRKHESYEFDGEILDEGLKDIVDTIKGILGKSEIEKAIEQSPIVRQMEQDAIAYAQDYVKGLVQMTKSNIKDLKSTKTLDKATDGKFSLMLKKGMKDEAKKAATLVVGSTKKGIKDMAMASLKKKVEQLPKEAKNIAKIYQAGINQIKSL